MNLKLIVAILVTTAMPVYAQAQDRNPVVTAAQRVVEIISSDPAKVETYCAIGKLGVQIEDANEAKDKKTADVLTQKMRGLEKHSVANISHLCTDFRRLIRNPKTAWRSRRC